MARLSTRPCRRHRDAPCRTAHCTGCRCSASCRVSRHSRPGFACPRGEEKGAANARDTPDTHSVPPVARTPTSGPRPASRASCGMVSAGAAYRVSRSWSMSTLLRRLAPDSCIIICNGSLTTDALSLPNGSLFDHAPSLYRARSSRMHHPRRWLAQLVCAISLQGSLSHFAPLGSLARSCLLRHRSSWLPHGRCAIGCTGSLWFFASSGGMARSSYTHHRA